MKLIQMMDIGIDGDNPWMWDASNKGGGDQAATNAEGSGIVMKA